MASIRNWPRLVVLLALHAALFPATAQAYNRDEVKAYASRWAVDPNSPDPEHANPGKNPEYWYYESGDCANFGSQCVIAGGIRFRGSIGEDDNIYPSGDPTPVGDPPEVPDITTVPELGTGIVWGPDLRFHNAVNTWGIRNEDTANYSRVVAAAENLKNSLADIGSPQTLRHLGRLYDTREELESDQFWTDVEVGDLIFAKYPDGQIYHTMIITQVDRVAHLLYISSHSNNLNNEPITSRTNIDPWLDNCVAVCLPDAPVVVADLTKVFATGREISWYLRDSRHRKGPTRPSWWRGTEASLEIQITFDTDMDAAVAADVQLDLSWWRTYRRFEPVPSTPNGWNEQGWWCGPNDITNARYTFRTWRGRIPASDIPKNSTMGTVTVVAGPMPFGETPEQWNDENNELSCYGIQEHRLGMRLIKISFDWDGSLPKNPPSRVPWAW